MTEPQDDGELQDLYRELILDHARKPRNFKRLDNATHTAEGINPLCGDKLHLYLHVDANDRITDIGFEGSGCAISMASASLLTETVSDLCVADADACSNVVTSRLTHKEQDNNDSLQVDISKLMALGGVREHPSRIKCATLAWRALHAALEQSSPTVTRE